MKFLYGSCVCPLGASLAFFASGNVVFGCFCLAGFSWVVFKTFKSWKTYQENWAEREDQYEKEQA